MKTVYKYPLAITDTQELTLPVGAEILCIKMQNETPCLWALVDPDYHTYDQTIKIRCAGTGHMIEEDIEEYLDTIIMLNGKLVFHFFKIK